MGPCRILLPCAMPLMPAAICADVALVEDGRPQATVVLPTNPSPGHRFAAEELVSHVAASTGVELPAVEEGQDHDGLPILVGDTSAARDRGEVIGGWGDLPADSFEVLIEPDRIVLHGTNPLANLYAVYDFLEHEIGVRWLTPDENGTHVPQHVGLTVAEARRLSSPAFRLRMFFVRSDETALWALRSRINGLFPAEWADKVDGDLAYLPPGIGAGIHSFADLVPPDRHFDEHPEYFPLIGGKRQPISIRSGQLCTSNPDVVRIIADQVRAYFDERPNARVFSVAPDDGKGWCECDACRKIDQELGQSRIWAEDGSTPVTTDRLMHFLNQVADQALSDHRDKTIVTLSYINYLPPPLTVEVDFRVMPLICHYAPACYAHRMSDPSCEANARFADDLRGWVEQCPNAGVYAYTDKSMWYYFWRPVFRLMAHDIRFLHETGIRNYLAQSSAAGWNYVGPLYWVTGRMLWDPTQDVDALIAEWCQAMYGPAGDVMLRHYNTLEQSVLATGRHYRDSPYRQAVGLYDMDLIDKAEAALTEAEGFAAEGTVYAEHVVAVRRRWTVSRACYDYLAAYRHYEESGDLADLKTAAQLAETLAQRAGGNWIPYSCPSAADIRAEIAAGGTRWYGFGKEETKGDRTCRNTDETGPGDGAAGWATLRFFVPDPQKATRLTMLVWGESGSFSPVICSKGHGAGSGSGGEWNRIGGFTASGRPEWQEVAFEMPPRLYEPGTRRQIVGFGGGDSQIWIAEVKVEGVED